MRIERGDHIVDFRRLRPFEGGDGGGGKVKFIEEGTYDGALSATFRTDKHDPSRVRVHASHQLTQHRPLGGEEVGDPRSRI